MLVDTAVGDAKARQQEGKARFERGDWSAAGVEFDRAYGASRDARMLWNIALTEKAQKHPVKALAALKRFVTERGPSLSGQESRDAEDLRKVLEPLTSKLQLTVSEPEAAVTIDEQPIGSTPIKAPIVLDPGTKRIRVAKAGFKEAVETETFTSGSTVTLEITLQPEIHQGRLHVKGSPSDTIWLDGRVVGQGQWDAPVPTGKHYVSVTAPGKRSYEAETTVGDAQMRDINVTLQADDGSPRSSTTWLWVTSGVVLAAGAVVGGYLLLRPTSSADGPIAGTFGTLHLPLEAR
jgi:hypothetical protein